MSDILKKDYEDKAPLESALLEKATAGTGDSESWVRRFCPNCGKDRSMSRDPYGNYTCLICQKEYSLQD